jgi:import inner membrane translocase subunit TIM50
MLSLWYVKREKGWQTFKRPGVDAFLEHLAQFYEIVIYSDEQSMVIGLFTPYYWSSIFSFLYISYHYLAFYWYVQFVDPVVERLDPKHCIRYRLSKAATKYQNGKHYRVRSS